jgi:hypothetical protein
MAALVIGSAYAAFREPPPQLLEETLALPPLATWQPDATLSRAHVINVLQGPALSVPEKATSAPAETESSLPPTALEPRSSQARSSESQATPYPDPTTTPPDAIAPLSPEPTAAPPPAGSENPYQD